MIKKDDDVNSVLKDDGVENIDLTNFQNKSSVSIKDIEAKLGSNSSWATRVTYNKDFGGVLIQQMPGEGNRMHFHPDAAEAWYILKGKWKWFIDKEGEKIVEAGSIINVKANTFHQITCIGDEPGLRLAITVPDVMHVYK